MSEENGAIIVPVYCANLGSRHSSYTSHQSRISYTSHGDLLGGMTKESRLRNRGSRNPSHALQPPPSITMGPFEANHKPTREYVSERGRLGGSAAAKQARLKDLPLLQDGSTECTDETGKVIKQPDNPFIEPTQTQTVVDMKGRLRSASVKVDSSGKRFRFFFSDVMVLNDIIEQAAGRHSRASDRGGNISALQNGMVFLDFYVFECCFCFSRKKLLIFHSPGII